MDRISWLGVIACVIALLIYYPAMQHLYPPKERSIPAQTQPKDAVGTTSHPSSHPAQPQEANRQAAGPFIDPNQQALKLQPDLPQEQLVSLENKWARILFTNHGGAIRHIELKEHKLDHSQLVVLNRGTPEPALNLTGWDAAYDLAGYTLAWQRESAVSFERTLENGCKLTRTYTLGENYQLHLQQTVDNKTDQTCTFPSYNLLVGVGEGPYSQPNERRYLSGSWYTEGGKYISHKIAEFDSGSFLFIFPKAGRSFITSNRSHDESQLIRWAAASSQFFTQILSSTQEAGTQVDLRKLALPELSEKNRYLPDGVETRLQMPGFALAPSQSKSMEWTYYAGPKQDAILRAMPFEQDRVMEFGWLGFIARPLLTLMNAIHRFVPNYGVAIILITLMIKLILWYPQASATRNMKQMQALSPRLRELQAKHKQDPMKLQQEMMKLYKEYGVNPLGGCLPLLIQLPIFISFYYMLTSAIELRHAPFLWIHDLSKPDTIARIPLGSWQFPINPMPLLMTAAMFWSMRLSPQPEGVDNANQKILKWMPAIMLFFCYGLSSALSLYWTMQNLLSVAQMYYNLRQPLPALKRIVQNVRRKSRK